ncbi:inositol monophosphatase family protein [Ligilactobacillus sp. Marseille-Q7487]|uniref:inositol monophosphatase family protein n=1 Tax=Ligilactobacillus sp. Marseille-Q7487 TaxID=3022128 RepID=UPI0024A95D6C|nr:inositol monophosphatase family protein [Ligilactobacillus sp. Marseille-Q7487]
MTDWQEINTHVQQWLQTVKKQIKASLQSDITVQTKTSRTDLVTNVDCLVEQYYTKQILKTFPQSQILGEESKHAEICWQKGLLWIIDPIDGTMNFVKQQANFTTMLAIYEDGQPKLAYILDVMQDKLYWGGPKCGVYCNDERLKAPADLHLKDGLVGISCPMLLNNYCNLQEVARNAAGTRIYGSAGIEYIHVLTGKCIAYVSHLRPWDYAPGQILAQSIGLVVKTIDGKAVNMLSSTDVLVATKNAQQEIAAIIEHA